MLQAADGYIVISKTDPIVDMKVLTFLYQPIIGTRAISLYLTLLNDADRLLEYNSLSTHYRLLSLTDLTINDLEKTIEKLEAIGLIKTYIKQDDIVSYLYEIYAPNDCETFFQDELLNSLLLSMLGKTEYERNLYYFKRKTNHLFSDYEDVSKSFKDVFEVSVDNKDSFKLKQINLKTKIQGKINTGFDFDKFMAFMDIAIPKKVLTPMVKKTIESLSVLYNVSEVELRRFVKDSYINGKIDLEQLRRRVYKYHDMTSDNNSEEEIIVEGYNVDPRIFLKNKQNGTLFTGDLQVIESVIIKTKFSYEVINYLIEYVLKQSNGRLNKNYLEKVASTWARNKVTTIDDAEKLINNSVYYNNKLASNIVPEVNKNETINIGEEFNEITHDKRETNEAEEIAKILAKLK